MLVSNLSLFNIAPDKQRFAIIGSDIVSSTTAYRHAQAHGTHINDAFVANYLRWLYDDPNIKSTTMPLSVRPGDELVYVRLAGDFKRPKHYSSVMPVFWKIMILEPKEGEDDG